LTSAPVFTEFKSSKTESFLNESQRHKTINVLYETPNGTYACVSMNISKQYYHLRR